MLKDYAAFVESKKKSGQAILDSLTPQRASIAHMLAGVQDEMMEVSLAIDNQDDENLREELGDLCFYIVGLAADYGLTLPTEPKGNGNGRSFEDVVTMIKRDIYYQKPINLTKLQENLNNMLYEFSEIAKELNTTLEELLQQNQDKLNKRYATGYSDQQAQDRADKQ